MSLVSVDLSSDVPDAESVDPAGSQPGYVDRLAVIRRRCFTSIDLHFKNLTFEVKEKTVLHRINGKFKSGDLNCIMGPSGAGKSTLLNVLAGFKCHKYKGNILVNGKPVDRAKFRKQSGFIMQDDNLFLTLTVYETIMTAASLKMPANERTRKQAVELVMKRLNLLEARDRRVGMLSGGERKRCSIAVELVNYPPVLFIDEPTSGLDSASCYQCICLFREIARAGCNIICTIHQPSAKVFHTFDTLYMVVKGRPMYSGPVKAIIPYFAYNGLKCPQFHNPADFIFDVAHGDHGSDNVSVLVDKCEDGSCKKYVSKFMSLSHDREKQSRRPKMNMALVEDQVEDRTLRKKKKHRKDTAIVNLAFEEDGSSDGDKYRPNRSKSRHMVNYEDVEIPSPWFRLKILTIRSWRTVIRDSVLTHLRFFSTLFVALLVGGTYWQTGKYANTWLSNAGGLFFGPMFILFTSMMPTILVYPAEMPIFTREYLNDWYPVKLYYLSKLFVDLPFQIIIPVMYGLIQWYMTGQPQEAGPLLYFLLALILTGLVSQSLGVMVGVVSSPPVAAYAAPVIVVPMLIFGGFLTKISLIPKYLRWISFICYIKYPFEGIVITNNYNREYICVEDPANDEFDYQCWIGSDGNKIISDVFGFEGSSGFQYKQIVMLLAFFVVFRVLGYILLRIKLWLNV